MNQSQTINMETLEDQYIKTLEDRLPPLFERHHATLRYIRAGFYLDAIHSILEGFSACQPSSLMESQRRNSTAMLIEIDDSLRSEEENNLLVIDRNPMDPCTVDGKSPPELLFLAMRYNLALSYHLYASSVIGEAEADHDKQSSASGNQYYCISDIVCDALHLYEEFSIRLHNLDPALKSSLSIPALQNNMRHVKLLHSTPRCQSSSGLQNNYLLASSIES